MCNAASERTVEQLAVKEREPDKPPMWNKSCQCDIDLERQKSLRVLPVLLPGGMMQEEAILSPA